MQAMIIKHCLKDFISIDQWGNQPNDRAFLGNKEKEIIAGKPLADGS